MRDVTVLIGRDSTTRHWEWNGTRVVERDAGALPDRPFAWVGSDAPRERVLAVTFQPLEVLSWDGAWWTSHSYPNGPTLDFTTHFAFDESRARLVAWHRGYTGMQTFEWDGQLWHDVTPATGPAARFSAGFAFDRASNRCILYGGIDSSRVHADCWAWDGATWTQLAATAAPGARHGPGMTFSSRLGGLLLYGGNATRSTWCLRGSTWTRVPTASSPPALENVQLVADPLGTLLLGGVGNETGESWRFDGVDWQPTGASFYSPAIDAGSSQVAYDRVRGQVVHYSGLARGGEVALFDTRWRGTSPTTGPVPRNRAAFAWSSGDQQVLLFGGIDGSNTVLNDTWSWDGADWIARSPANSPSPRRLALAAEDPNGGVLLYGGLDPANNELDEHWHWNGVDWTQLQLANRPSNMSGGGAVLDPRRRVTVAVSRLLFGPVASETWEWDGQAWSLAATSPVTTYVFTARLAYHAPRNAVIAAGIRFHEWTGTAWIDQGPGNLPSAVVGAVADDARQRTLFVGNPVLQLTDTPATLATIGSGCAFGPAPVLSAIDRPQPGNLDFAIEVATRLPNAATFVVLGFGQQAQSLGFGCTSYVANAVGTRFGLASAGSQLRVPLPIPNDPALRDVTFVAQGAVVDPGRSLIGGVTVTAGLRVTIGD